MGGPHGSRTRFLLERLIQRGAGFQLLLMTAMVALVALVGGTAAWLATARFEGLPEAVWWAFLRLTDPGYLGDDEGTRLRVISTAVTVLGYVLFMGSLIAIMTQWLSRVIRQLESGLTPIAFREHIVVLGWTDRTPVVVGKLLGGRGRLARFLSRVGTRRLRIVILAEDAGARLRQELRERLGSAWREGQIFLRAGSGLRFEHLQRVAAGRAATIVIPGAEFEPGGTEASDARAVKTLLTLARLVDGLPADERPHVVVEIFDSKKVPLARGAVELAVEVVAAERILGRLLSQSVRHPGLAPVLLGLFQHNQGNSIYLRDFPELDGRPATSIDELFPRAVVLGFLRSVDGELRTDLDPLSQAVLEPGDQLVLLARTFDDCRPAAGDVQPPTQPQAARIAGRDAHCKRVLILGWSRKIKALLSELDESCVGTFELTVVSRYDRDQRTFELERDPPVNGRVRVTQLTGDFALAGDLERIDPYSYDHVLFLASDWLDTAAAADARTILGYTLLRALSRQRGSTAHSPGVLVELLEPSSAALFEPDRDTLLVTHQVLSHVLAHVALRPEINTVYDRLFGAGGSEFALAQASELGLAGSEVSFLDMQRACGAHGLTALGLVTPAGGVELNPERSLRWVLAPADHVVVLASEYKEQGA